jgi:hypothetical protein
MNVGRGIVACAGLTLFSFSLHARADGVQPGLAMKWSPPRYTAPISVEDDGTTTPLAGWNTTSLDSQLGVFFLDGRFGAVAGLDFGWSSVRYDGAGLPADSSFTQVGFSIGTKYHIVTPARERVSPYFSVDFFKYFASISTHDDDVSSDEAGYVAALASPLGIGVAFGAEYFFTPAFSIGGEALGLKLAYAEAELPGGGSRESRYAYVTLYTAITLNFRFLTDDEQAKRVDVEDRLGEDDPPPREDRRSDETPQSKPQPMPERAPEPALQSPDEVPPEKQDDVPP